MAGEYRGLFCVFLLLILVAILAVASLVLQIFTWNLVMDRDRDGSPTQSPTLPPRSGRRQEPQIAIDVRENLAMFQPDNGFGPSIKTTLDHYDSPMYYDDHRVWIMAILYGGTNLGFYDEGTGKSGGYFVDIVNAVCKAAGKKCKIVAVNGACWETDPSFGARGGLGLISGWFDACIGYSPSYIRTLTFDFTEALSPPPDIYFYTLPGNPDNFNWRDLRGKKIGFLNSWYSDADCVARNADQITGANLNTDQVLYYEGTQALLTAIQNREVDAGFFTAESTELADALEPASNKITNCALGGDAVMVPKDSQLPDWWKPAFRSVVAGYEYRRICKDLDNYYSNLPGRSSEFICRSDL